jgi:glutamine synthetase
VSLVNTVLNTIVAEKFAEFADAIEGGADPATVARESLAKHWKVVFNGNGYDPAMQKELTDRGIWRIDSGVEAMARLAAEKNIALFEKMGVLSKDECASRTDIMHSHYVGMVEMEASCMIDMILQHAIPSMKAANLEGSYVADLQATVPVLKDALAAIHKAESPYEQAKLARVLRLETMVEIRATCDAAEAVCPANLWTLATYKELLFLDSHTHASTVSGAY